MPFAQFAHSAQLASLTRSYVYSSSLCFRSFLFREIFGGFMSTAFGARLSCRTKKPSHAGRAQNTLQDRHPVLTALGSSTLRPLRKAHVLAMQQLARKKKQRNCEIGIRAPVIFENLARKFCNLYTIHLLSRNSRKTTTNLDNAFFS